MKSAKKSGQKGATLVRLLIAVSLLAMSVATATPNVASIINQGNSGVLADGSAAASTLAVTTEPIVELSASDATGRPGYWITIDSITGGPGSPIPGPSTLRVTATYAQQG